MYITVLAKSCTVNSLILHPFHRTKWLLDSLPCLKDGNFWQNLTTLWWRARRSIRLLIKWIDIHIPTYN
nr:MAG TPA: hypothetical protein [Caudoviricetes sp.]